MKKIFLLAGTRKLPFVIGAVVLILLVVAGGILTFTSVLSPAQPAPTKFTVPTNPAIEERWGIRITQIGVTADGGMVDMRFVVLDADKALAMMSDQKNLPILAAEDSGIYVNSAALMSARHSLNPGTTYFMLYRNTRGAIKPNTPVTVLFSDEMKLEHVRAI